MNQASDYLCDPSLKDLPEVHYESEKGRYLTKDSHGNYMAVSEASLKNRLHKAGLSKVSTKEKPLSPAENWILKIQNEHNIAYSGPLAGYDAGLHRHGGHNILVTTSRKKIEPRALPWPNLEAVFKAIFCEPEVDQRPYFFGYLKIADETLNYPKPGPDHRIFVPGPALAIAGKKNSGKTLISDIVVELLGGRRGKPYRYMMGLTTFNSDLFWAEVQLVDDEVSSLDARARRAFGYQIKNMNFASGQSAHGKKKDAFTLFPFWRLLILLNDEPESLHILPAIDDSLEDKIMLLRATRNPFPMPSDTPEEREQFWKVLTSELPGFLWWLRNEFVISAEFRYPRIGIKPYKHPVLLEQIDQLAPENRLLALVDSALFNRTDQEDWQGTAEELLAYLCSTDFAYEVRTLARHSNACGSYLGKLAKSHPDRIIYVRKEDYRGWRIVAPNTRVPVTAVKTGEKTGEKSLKEQLDEALEKSGSSES